MVNNTPNDVLWDIRKYMFENNILIKELAAKMDSTPAAVSKIFQSGSPRLATLMEICNALNLNIDISFKPKDGK